jgi:hypothetical protein
MQKGSYQEVKTRFEKEFCKIKELKIYIREHVDEKTGYSHLDRHTAAQLAFVCRKWKYRRLNPQGVERVVPFLPDWLADPAKRQYNDVIMDPKEPRGENAGDFNLWTGFAAQALNPADYFKDMDQEQIREHVMGPIMNYLVTVISDIHYKKPEDSIEEAEYILNWLAAILQFPLTSSGAMPIHVNGPEGVRVCTLFTWFRENIIGPSHSADVSEPSKSLFKCAANDPRGVVLLHVFNPKPFKGGYPQIPDHTRVVFSSIGPDPKLADPLMDMARYELNASFGGGRAYFNTLDAHLAHPGVVAYFYKFLVERDIAAFHQEPATCI